MKATPAAARLTAEGCYRALLGDRAERLVAEYLLGRRHWIHGTADFDERTGEMLAGPLGRVCARLLDASSGGPTTGPKDRLYRILDHARKPLVNLLPRLQEGLVREHAMLPLRAVRELDTASVYALGRRPGRTIREKLANQPYLWAARRRWTVDTAENRLVKVFCMRVADLTRTRATSIRESDVPWLGELQTTVEAWLQSPAAREIGRWENLPPNNILLQHRDYRRVWDAWLWIHTLDEDTRRDHEHRLEQWTVMAFWSIVSELANSVGVRLVEQPCYPDYEGFTLVPGRSRTPTQLRVDGVFSAFLRGQERGGVVRLCVDKNKEGYGFAALKDNKSAFFHSRMFSQRSDFDRVRVGTVLAFDLVETVEGKLRAEHPEVVDAPGELRVELDVSSGITLHTSAGAIGIDCYENGQQVRVALNSTMLTTEMSAEGASEVARVALRAVLGVRDRESPRSSLATQLAPSGGATVCVVDLCFLRPRFAVGDRYGALPFRLLWQQWRQSDRAAVEIDLGTAKAIALGADISTVSILDLFAAEPAVASSLLSQAAKFFAARCKEALGGRALVYIVPDATDDFALGALRRSVNAVYPLAAPLPRSIASVFAWQSSPEFVTSAVVEGDCVLVLDTVGDTVSATPLLARRNNLLEERIAESAGIYWERCPCVLSGPRCASQATAVRLLERLGCSFPEEIARLCGFQGVVDEGDGVSWQHENGAWYTAVSHLEPAIQGAVLDLENAWAELSRGLQFELGRLTTSARVFILLAGDGFRRRGRDVSVPAGCLGRDVLLIGHGHEPHRGGLLLSHWQATAGDIPLWRDHLPELSMRILRNGRQERFHLVKNVTVVPRRDRVVPIEIEETFILPAGMPDYRFPLLQGSESSDLRYEAFLKSSAFPLKEDMPVTLRLTYAYGTDTPYDLIFAPVNPAPGVMSSVRAEWRSRTELPSHFPALPAPTSWARFQQYPKRNSTETTDLLEWICGGLKRLKSLVGALSEPRRRGTASDWKTDRNGRRFLYVNCEGERVFCHEDEFIEPGEVENLHRGDLLILAIERGGKGPLGHLIAIDTGSDQTDNRVQKQKFLLFRDALKKVLRFPFGTVWADGHSLAESEAPEAFRNAVRKETDILRELLLLEPAQDPAIQRAVWQVSDEALFLLCCMHEDAPPEVADRLHATLSTKGGALAKLSWYSRHIAMALGNCRLAWQRSLLDRVIMLLREPVSRDASKVCLRILGTALWRCGALLEALAPADLTTVVDQVVLVLRDDLLTLSSGSDNTVVSALGNYLELVLGLLRTRGATDDDVRGILAPGKTVTKDLARIVEGILDVVSTRSYPVRSRISLNVDKPQALDNTPDLLYALKLYLTGDAGAQAIQVVDIEDDADD